jgi:hypothetical protein
MKICGGKINFSRFFLVKRWVEREGLGMIVGVIFDEIIVVNIIRKIISF